MKKILILLAVFSLALTGCSGGNLENVNKSSSKEIKRFEQPEDKPDVAGLVKSITGNQVTILKIDQPRRMNKMSGDANSEENTDQEGDLSGKSKTLSLTGTGSTRMPGGGGMMGGRKPDDMDEDSRSIMLEKMKEMSSGEETVIVPVGIQMLKMDEDSREMVNADLTDITENSMISIWLNKEITDRQIADFVLIK
jgi:hypothetical protein